jgi:hypothetical protein
MEDKIVSDPRADTVRRVLELARQNKSYTEIGNMVGLSRQRVSQICLKHGIVRRPTDIKRENWERYWETNKLHQPECLYMSLGICTCGLNAA